MSAFEVPLIANTAQRLSVSMSNVQYQVKAWFNPTMECWVLDISDANDIPILHGVPMITGADLLGQYEYLSFVGQLVSQTDQAVNTPPTYENLGVDGHLYYVTEAA